MAENVSDLDLLHLHVAFTEPVRMAASAAIKARRPYVVSPHGLLDPWRLQEEFWKKRPYLHFLERENLARAAVLHATSGLEARFVNALAFGPPVYTLSLAVEAKICGESEFTSDGSFRLLCIARIHPVKALPVLFESLAILRCNGHNAVSYTHLDVYKRQLWCMVAA